MNQTQDYSKLTIRNHFMFGKICSKTENCELILNALLQKNLSLKKSEVEKYLQEYNNAKFARLDLLVEDNLDAVYNAELQHLNPNNDRQLELPKRSRYYQALLDTAYFKSGKHYILLPETYVIFICTFDPFGRNLPIYTFETKCLETELPEYNDFAHKIFFNTAADLSILPLDMKNMLEYIDKGIVSDDATKILEKEVQEARLKEDWRAEYMLTVVHDNDVYVDGYDTGYDSGYDDASKARQAEIDNLNDEIESKDKEIEQLKLQLSEYQKRNNPS